MLITDRYLVASLEMEGTETSLSRVAFSHMA